MQGPTKLRVEATQGPQPLLETSHRLSESIGVFCQDLHTSAFLESAEEFVQLPQHCNPAVVQSFYPIDVPSWCGKTDVHTVLKRGVCPNIICNRLGLSVSDMHTATWGVFGENTDAELGKTFLCCSALKPIVLTSDAEYIQHKEAKLGFRLCRRHIDPTGRKGVMTAKEMETAMDLDDQVWGTF